MAKERQSNVELLRIIAMFLILLVHADFYSLGEPSYTDITSESLDTFLRIFFEVVSIPAVNIFVMISGWFGIHAKLKGLCSFLFQCLFFTIGLYLLNIICGYATFSIQDLLNCLMLTPANWFIKSYLFLYILSPVLNTFVDTASRIIFKHVLIAYFTILIILGWLFPESVTYISLGYSPVSFIGLYLLSRYTNIYRPFYCNLKARSYAVIVAVISICSIAICIPPENIKWIYPYVINRIFNYVSPINVAIALFLLIMFSKFRIKSKLINWFSTSCFAVFLFHTNALFLGVSYKDMCKQIYLTHSVWDYWIIIFFLMIGIFIVSVLIDKIRILIWNILSRFIKVKFNVAFYNS